jgi:hypothetical protein
MKNWIRLGSLACALATVACSPVSAGNKQASAVAGAPTVAPTLHPVSGLAVVPLSIATAKGPHVFQVEVAASPAEQEHGLMFRTAMGADEGMIFPMDPPRRSAFWMKNTVIGLDIVFIDSAHKITNIAANAVPYDLSPLPSAGPIAAVLELNAGRAAELGIKPGDKVDW